MIDKAILMLRRTLSFVFWVVCAVFALPAAVCFIAAIVIDDRNDEDIDSEKDMYL